MNENADSFLRKYLNDPKLSIRISLSIVSFLVQLSSGILYQRNAVFDLSKWLLRLEAMGTFFSESFLISFHICLLYVVFLFM